MPNWCYTSLTVSGPAEDITRFREGIENNKDEEGNISILRTYYPCPKDLEVVEGWSLDTDEQDAREAVYAANVAKHGFRSWYDWNCENWGSKWSDCSTDLQDDSEGLTELVYNFETAWSPISAGIKHVSSMFPTLAFVMSYDEEAGFYVGAEAYLAGKDIYFEQEEPNLDQKEDEDDDDYYDRVNEHRNDLRYQFECRAEEALASFWESVG